MQILTHYGAHVGSLAYPPVRGILLTRHSDGVVLGWDLSTRPAVFRAAIQKYEVRSLAVSPNGHWLCDGRLLYDLNGSTAWSAIVRSLRRDYAPSTETNSELASSFLPPIVLQGRLHSCEVIFSS